MIQASNLKPIAPKASPEVKSKSSTSAKPKDLEGSLESQDFDNELRAASGSDESQKAEKSQTKNSPAKKSATDGTDSNHESGEVKSVKVSPEMELEKPSDLINAQAGQSEPKVFDADLTESVQNILQPKKADAGTASAVTGLALVTGDVEVSNEAAPVKLSDAQVLQLANGEAPVVDGEVVELNKEITQAMLKIPQVKGDRSPAIDFAKSEIDPQLLGNEDFVAQKNLVAKKNINPSAYGMNKPQLQKMALENGLKQTQIIQEASQVEGTGQGPINSQQFILNMQNELNGTPKVNETGAPQKVFDMSNIKSANSSQIIDQISNYVVQAKAAKEPTVTMRVNHEQLGMIDITVQKSMTVGNDALAINIGTHSVDGKNFFQQNSRDLFSHLTNAGISVSELKVEVPSQTARNDFDSSQQQSGRGGSEGKQQFESEQNQRRHDSDRRQDLWKLLSDKEAA